MPATDPLRTPTAAAEQLSVHPATIVRMCRDGRLRAIRLDDGRYRVPQSALDAYVAAHTLSAEPVRAAAEPDIYDDVTITPAGVVWHQRARRRA